MRLLRLVPGPVPALAAAFLLGGLVMAGWPAGPASAQPQPESPLTEAAPPETPPPETPLPESPLTETPQSPPEPVVPETPLPHASMPAPVLDDTLPVRMLDLDRLLTESRPGQALLAELQAAERALEAENQALADELAREERRLTDLRPELGPEEFRARADDFDRRVEIIRTERARLARDLAERYEIEAQRFFDAALPVLSALMQEQGIVALLRPEAVIVAAEGLDVTDTAIEMLDRAMSP